MTEDESRRSFLQKIVTAAAGTTLFGLPRPEVSLPPKDPTPHPTVEQQPLVRLDLSSKEGAIQLNRDLQSADLAFRADLLRALVTAPADELSLEGKYIQISLEEVLPKVAAQTATPMPEAKGGITFSSKNTVQLSYMQGNWVVADKRFSLDILTGKREDGADRVKDVPSFLKLVTEMATQKHTYQVKVVVTASGSNPWSFP